MRSILQGRSIIAAVRFLRSNRRILTPNIKQTNLVKYVNTPPIKILTLVGLFWPLKKEAEKVETKTPTILENGLNEADQLFDNGQFDECHEGLKTLRLQHSNNVEILWRLARALFQMASRPNVDQNIKKKLALEAFEAITEAMKLNENNFAVHKWTAAVLDLKSSCDGTKERITNLETVKKHMQRAAEINPSDATTLYMLGEWCYGIADLPWYQRKIAQTVFAKPPESTFEEALAFFTKAEVAEPNFYSMNYLMLGKCYIKLGNNDAAKHYLILARSYPARTNDDHEANKQAQELLKQLA